MNTTIAKIKKTRDYKIVFNCNNKMHSKAFTMLYVCIPQNQNKDENNNVYIENSNVHINKNTYTTKSKDKNKIFSCVTKNIHLKYNIAKNSSESAGDTIKLNQIPDKIIYLGVIASKKIGGAVKRNRAKRLLRTAVRTIVKNIKKNKFGNWAANDDLALVLIAKYEILNTHIDDIIKDISYKIKIIRNIN